MRGTTFVSSTLHSQSCVAKDQLSRIVFSQPYFLPSSPLVSSLFHSQSRKGSTVQKRIFIANFPRLSFTARGQIHGTTSNFEHDPFRQPFPQPEKMSIYTPTSPTFSLSFLHLLQHLQISTTHSANRQSGSFNIRAIYFSSSPAPQHLDCSLSNSSVHLLSKSKPLKDRTSLW